ncbi:uncharacterized protein LOC134204496 [Armigeres subalbatus]|uniref:uncharacterized protein LOC134204496 n=1 Tax=Armigeres subalbatus TaxID=124917 RepID=UPI002ED34F76
MAERRLKCLENRLTKSPELYEKMRQQRTDYQAKDYAHQATPQELQESDPKRYAKNVNADDHAEEFPKAAVAIKENHYVDDYLDSVDSVDEAVQLALEVKTVHDRAGFQTRHWTSNATEVLKRIGEQNSQAAKSFVMDKGSQQERILGMVWLPTEDMFSYTTNFPSDLKRLFDLAVIPTKQEVLRLVMSLFDPVGLVASFVVEEKVIIQEIWRAKVGWDESIPSDIVPRWQQWLEVLRTLDKVKIPRCYFPKYSKEAYESLELHIFVDASESAFAAVTYFRIVDKGHVRCCLMGAKTKLAPLKQLSIPRLELQAATIGAQLMKSITESHTVSIKRRLMWCDSRTVLSWLRSDQRRYRQFVAFRVMEILEETSVGDWRWVPSKQNVADEATKWGKSPDYIESCRWFKGPAFLYEDESQWPVEDVLAKECTNEELRNVHVNVQFHSNDSLSGRGWSEL